MLRAVSAAGKLPTGVDPDEVVAEARRPEDLVAEQLHWMHRASVEVEVEGARRRKEVADQLQPRGEHRDETGEAARLAVRVRGRPVPARRAGVGRRAPTATHAEGLAGAERGIEIDEIHPSRELGQERRQGPQVVTGHEPPRCRAVRPREPLDDAQRLHLPARDGPRAVRPVLAGPGQLQVAAHVESRQA